MLYLVNVLIIFYYHQVYFLDITSDITIIIISTTIINIVGIFIVIITIMIIISFVAVCVYMYVYMYMCIYILGLSN